MVLEEHGVALRERQFSDGHDLALDLAGRIREPELRHVAQPGRLTPARIGDQIPLVEWRAAGVATRSLRLILSLAPLALDPIHWAGLSHPADGCRHPGKTSKTCSD